MDLDRCPKCGARWSGGDFCNSCKFVPIGVGLDKLPKKKKKKNRKYVEPGSSRGFLVFILIGAVGYGSFRYQPWKDDWELVRSLFGQGRHHSLVGEWEVVKTVAISPDKAWASKTSVKKGTVKFSAKGSVDIDLVHESSDTVATGKYVQNGVKVALRDVRTTGEDESSIPGIINMNLAWTGNDTVIAIDKSQAIYLHRHKKGNPLLTFMQMGLKKGSQTDKDATVPDGMRGVIGNMQRAADDADK
jgi:hypothetical protein